MMMNQAKLQFISNSTDDVEIFGISDHCFKCNLQFLGQTSFGHPFIFAVDSIWPYRIQLKTKNTGSQTTFQHTQHFSEGGEYNISFDQYEDQIVNFQSHLINKPTNQYLPLIVLSSFLLGFIILWPLFKLARRHIRKLKGEETNYFMEMEEWEQKIDSLSRDNTNNSDERKKRNQRKKRLRSIDVFRGITICLMIFVNYGGGGYHFFQHSVWNGLTITDLVFPWFMFIMGISITLSFNSFRKSAKTYKQAFVDILVRSVKLFALGMLLNMGQNMTTWRVPGVLQRFAICYLFVATLNLFTYPSQKTLILVNSRSWTSPFKDLVPHLIQWFIMFAIVASHIIVTFKLDVPGCPRGYLGPGGLDNHGHYENCTGGAAGYIDRLVLGDNHIYGYPTCKEMYQTKQHFDPEGILGILPSLLLTFLGVHAGEIITLFPSHKSRLLRWLVWALITAGIGISMTFGTLNEGIIPINKNLWSISFVLVSASTCYIMMILCYLLNDIRRIWNGAPFYFCGMNAIALYLGHMLIPFNFYWHTDPQTHTSATVRAGGGTLIWIIWAYYLYWKKLFFTV
ncbi:heparan-alpha-glucosaminide N-acetyltransferase-like [Clytia hemisphaerica]|uniref:Heparan-alpha-glucosaminide N-acetyltransferase catalytic domain-containing protein n=1 Tax=Clytia hemisphaerica TaxID=252671 RepID=A0A7M5VA40_9CNID